jgi:hypothetical protein
MSVPLVVIVTAIYVAVAASEFSRGNPPMTIVFCGYAFANLGLIWSMTK